MSKKASKEKIKEAFRKTISRWEKIVKDPDYCRESYCHLCILENDEGDDVQRCNDSCPVKSYKGEDNWGCRNTPYSTFFNHKTEENAKAELNFLREVFLDFLEDEIQEQIDELGKAIKEEIVEKKEEWVNVTRELTAKVDMISGNQGYIKLYHNGHFIMYTQTNHKIEGLELVSSHCDYKVETKDGDFTVSKRIKK